MRGLLSALVPLPELSSDTEASQNARGQSINERWYEFVKTNNPRLREELIEEHLPLALQLARRFRGRGEYAEDLGQVASLALIGAVDRFDPERGVEFGAYATRTIIGEMKRYLRDKGWDVKAPRRLQELYLEVGHAITELTQKNKRSPTIDEIATHIRSESESVIEALVAGQGYANASLDVPSEVAAAAITRTSHIDQNYAKIEDLELLEPLLMNLSSRDRKIMTLRFVDGLSQSEISAEIGISQMQVSRIISSSLSNFRRHLTGSNSKKPIGIESTKTI